MHDNNFIPTYLYIKQHSITGKLYFGKTTKKDPIKYKGSGDYWINHIKKYGKEYIETLWYCLFLDEESITKFAINFSIQENIVESNQWANLKLENGLDGGATVGRIISIETKRKISLSHIGMKHSEETKQRMIKNHVGTTGQLYSIETKRKMSESQFGRKHSEETLIKLSESHKGYIQRIVNCPHCDKEGGITNMKRWHFDNCKFKRSGELNA